MTDEQHGFEIDARVGEEVDTEELANLSPEAREEVLDALEGAEDHAEDLPDAHDTGRSDDTDNAGNAGDAGDTPDTPDETKSLSETGLLDENDEFPWEGESLGKTDVGEGGVIERFRYKRTEFEVSEPEDRRKFEDNFETLQGVQEIDDEGKRRATSDRYARKVAEQCLTVERHPISTVYRVEHNDDAYVVADPDGQKGLASHSAAEPIWEAMTWFDRFKIGMRIGEDVLGERQFRQTRS